MVEKICEDTEHAGGAIRNEKEKKENWEKFKLIEVLKNPVFVGKTVRLGNSIFEVKGVDVWIRTKNENTNQKIPAESKH